MKIHESMNCSFYTKKFFFFLLATCWFSLGALAQSQNIEVYREKVLKNGIYQHDFNQYHASLRPQREIIGNHGISYFNPSNNGNNNGPFGAKGYPAANHFFYKPNTGFTGRDTVIVSYYKQYGNGSNIAAFKIFYFTVVPSFLQANDDYVATIENQPIEIAVLPNDIGNGTDQTISEVTNTNNGTASLNSDSTKVLFSPTPGFKGIANLNYSICDAQGSCSFAVVNICVNAINPPTNETLTITTNKNVPQVVMLDMDASYVVSQSPAHGTLSNQQPFFYTPNQNYVGPDQIVFQNPAGNTRTVVIKVVNVPRVSDLTINDVVFTPKGQVLEEIHLLDNDNGGQYFGAVNVITAGLQGTLLILPQLGKGVYRYTPPVGFTGVDKFKYRAIVGPNNAYDTATCYIVVNDLNPSLTTFQMTTPKNTPLVLGDHLPLDAYTYQAFSDPDKGNLAFISGNGTYTSSHGQTFSGKNMLVYDPDTDETGYDEFEFEYCADGLPTGCKLVKVELQIVEVAAPQTNTLCAGSECVWAGDTNRDGAVDVLDVLPIGMCMGEVGQVRSNGSTDWYGQYANNWNSFFVTGLGFDVKYLDTDGNGIVSSMDTTAIGQNYGHHHNLTPNPVESFENLPFYIEEPNFPENPEVGDVFYAPIGLGNLAFPAINAYGLAFELLYDPAIFEVNVYFDDNTWMDYNSPILSKTQKPLPGKIDAAYTRTSGLAASGFGHIGVAEFIVIDDIAGGRPDKLNSKVTLNSLGLMNGNGQTMGIGGDSFTIKLGGDDKEVKPIEENQLMVYPNPASQAFTLHLNGFGHEMERVMVYNMTGGLVYDSGKMTAKRMMVNVADFAPGMYTVKVLANGEALNKKIEVIK